MGDDKQKKEKKGFFANLFAKVDKKMQSLANEGGGCSCSSKTDGSGRKGCC